MYRAILVIALAASSARAQPTPRGVCVDPRGCSGSSTSSSNNSAANAAARRAEKALFRQIDRENAERKKTKAVEKARRNANTKALAAARKNNWKKALELFEQAHRRYPQDSRISANLAAVRGKIAERKAKRDADIAAKQAKTMPPAVVPPPPIETPAKPIATAAITIGTLTTRLVEVPAPVDAAGWRTTTAQYDITAVLDAKRKEFATVAPDAKGVTDVIVGVTKSIGAQFVPGATSLVSFRDRINGAGRMKERYNQLARNLVDEATRATSHTAALLGGGETDPDYDVHAAPRRMQLMVIQFVSDELETIFFGKIKGWGNRMARGIAKDAVAP